MEHGLAMYEMIKVGFGIFVLIIILVSLSYCLYTNISKNYQLTTGIISNINDNNSGQILTYTVDKTIYKPTLVQQPNIMITDKNGTRSCPHGNPQVNSFGLVIGCNPNNQQYSVGTHNVYYAKSNPEDYNLDVNPTFMIEVITGIICCLLIIAIITFIFFSRNEDVAATFGGVSILSSLFNK
jgi:hypothetical protein